MLLNDSDLVFGQIVEFVHQLVNLPVRCVNLALEDRLVVGCLRRGQLPAGLLFCGSSGS